MLTTTEKLKIINLKKSNPDLYFLMLLEEQKQSIVDLIRPLIKNEIIDELKPLLENKNIEISDITERIVSKITQNVLDDIIKEPVKKIDEKLQLVDKKISEIKNGEDYILTENDKNEIALKIPPLPPIEKVIQKTEVIREQPIITNEIVEKTVEVAKYEEGNVIVDKINNQDNKIKRYIIEGLQEEFDNLKKTIREISRTKGVNKGGGMGNPQHERFTVTTATSTVSLNYKIAAQGNAIMSARYQGQVLDKDVHYTVGSDYKTITFDSTMQAQFVDNDVFSITYIRT